MLVVNQYLVVASKHRRRFATPIAAFECMARHSSYLQPVHQSSERIITSVRSRGLLAFVQEGRFLRKGIKNCGIRARNCGIRAVRGGARFIHNQDCQREDHPRRPMRSQPFYYLAQRLFPSTCTGTTVMKQMSSSWGCTNCAVPKPAVGCTGLCAGVLAKHSLAPEGASCCTRYGNSSRVPYRTGTRAPRKSRQAQKAAYFNNSRHRQQCRSQNDSTKPCRHYTHTFSRPCPRP